ncbi:MAG TPA: tetratricopeptide repeat protein [Phycisphaerales bacterium]|nr:tetratricopeptide repeat protein [Phycisphaerales bacterium]
MAEPLLEKARQAAQSDDFDAAIELFLQALRADPESVAAHIELRDAALARRQKGGIGPTEEDKRRLNRSHTPLERLLDAEFLLARDPNHLPYAEAMLRAAVDAKYAKSVRWIGDLMFLANNNARKPSLALYLLLKDAYAAVGHYDRAVAACQRAKKLQPEDRRLTEDLRTLTTKLRAAGRGQPASDLDEQGSLSDVDHTTELAAADPTADGPSPEDIEKAATFFEKARKTAETGNFDYAIEMYLEGLKLAPDALEQGHLPLCELALKRQSKGGKKPSMMERVKRLGGKTPLEQMLNAEYLFAKDPAHLPYAESMLEAAVAAGLNKTAGWLANLVFQTNNAAAKPSLKTYKLLKDVYRRLGQFDKALAACQRARQIKPNDPDLAEDFKFLSAELTMARGHYDKEGDFRNSIKDRDQQEQLQSQQGVVKSQDYRALAVETARKKLIEDPSLPKNILNLADALSEVGAEKAANEAVALLEDSYHDTDNFTFKQRAGELKIKQIRRGIRQAKSALAKHPDNGAARNRLKELTALLNTVELEHYRLCSENYPTDLRLKYEHALRLVRLGQYDQAIPLLQEAQREPGHKISAMNQIGLCFFLKGWHTDAVDVFAQAVDAHEIPDDAMAKELRYNLARAYEEKGELDKALESYRKVAHLDFAYKDISKRIEDIRNSGSKPT